jgi:photosystem II stability/assembly factor-like uncharacterized protein
MSRALFSGPAQVIKTGRRLAWRGTGDTMLSRRARFAAVAAAVFFGNAALAAGDAGAAGAQRSSTDVLDRPAMQSTLAAKKLLVGMARAGDKLVAVGPRGHIVVTADGGQTWTQAKVPVSSDLTAVWFANATRGWAVGHDGVVLATTDGGATWTKQMDGRVANGLVLKDIQAKLAANPDSEALKGLATEAERNVQMGADKPFLDVWFENETTGFVVGAYNLIFATTDGGKTWQSWFDRVPNPRFMSLYSIRPAAGSVFIAGEQGTFFRLDREAMKFDAVPVDYQGSLFGVVDAGDAVLTYGIKGNVFRTADSGKTWAKVDSTLRTMIVGGITPAPGTVILADQSGHLSMSKDGGNTFGPLELPKTVPLTGVIDAGDGKLGLTGPFGALVVTPGAAPKP